LVLHQRARLPEFSQLPSSTLSVFLSL